MRAVIAWDRHEDPPQRIVRPRCGRPPRPGAPRDVVDHRRQYAHGRGVHRLGDVPRRAEPPGPDARRPHRPRRRLRAVRRRFDGEQPRADPERPPRRIESGGDHRRPLPARQQPPVAPVRHREHGPRARDLQRDAGRDRLLRRRARRRRPALRDPGQRAHRRPGDHQRGGRLPRDGRGSRAESDGGDGGSARVRRRRPLLLHRRRPDRVRLPAADLELLGLHGLLPPGPDGRHRRRDLRRGDGLRQRHVLLRHPLDQHGRRTRAGARHAGAVRRVAGGASSASRTRSGRRSSRSRRGSRPTARP